MGWIVVRGMQTNADAPASPDTTFPPLSFVCPKLWTEMPGDERTRFCVVCGLHVHNLSALTADERASLRRNTQGRLCATYQRRLDGTYVTPTKPLTETERVRMRQVGAIALSAAALTVLAGCVTQSGMASLPSPASDTTAATDEDEIVFLACGITAEASEKPYLTTTKVARRHRQ